MGCLFVGGGTVLAVMVAEFGIEVHEEINSLLLTQSNFSDRYEYKRIENR